MSCFMAMWKEYVGRPVIQVLDSGINFCSFHQKTMDMAMFVAMLHHLLRQAQPAGCQEAREVPQVPAQHVAHQQGI